ncbi:ubiquitin-conjugating enzyme E2 2 (UBC2) [Vairimorpha necatrix]|uniref:Ubiquitin-conjugating enzyme E2 2 (UBC2) n=1 Tax=Vairimorpha necatrix TaxID=6039 RepID=A0AAX4JDR2_9MICR
MNSSAQKRLLKDYSAIKNNIDKTIFASPLDNNIFLWVAIILGPENTPFEDGTFNLVLIFDNTYPQNPPKVKFLSKMFHPNVYQNGELCLDMLKNRWSPSYDILGILISIQSLLNDPNIKSPANLEAADLYENDKLEYSKKVKETVIRSWVDTENIN